MYIAAPLAAPTTYIAPDLLPERTEIETALGAKWDPDLPVETVKFDYPLLHSGVVRSRRGRALLEKWAVGL